MDEGFDDGIMKRCISLHNAVYGAVSRKWCVILRMMRTELIKVDIAVDVSSIAAGTERQQGTVAYHTAVERLLWDADSRSSFEQHKPLA